MQSKHSDCETNLTEINSGGSEINYCNNSCDLFYDDQPTNINVQETDSPFDSDINDAYTSFVLNLYGTPSLDRKQAYKIVANTSKLITSIVDEIKQKLQKLIQKDC